MPEKPRNKIRENNAPTKRVENFTPDEIKKRLVTLRDDVEARKERLAENPQDTKERAIRGSAPYKSLSTKKYPLTQLLKVREQILKSPLKLNPKEKDAKKKAHDRRRALLDAVELLIREKQSAEK